MQPLMTLAVAVAATSTTLIAHADVIDAKFSGTVTTQTSSSFAVGAMIGGEFLYDTVTTRYLSFTVGGQSVALGFISSAALTPDLYSALYEAQLSPLQGGTFNSTFTVDLEGLMPWPSNSAVALLSNAGQLATNLDTGLSNFGFYRANADGTGVHSLSATLTGIQVSAVPEPSTSALLLVCFAAGLRRVRRLKGSN